MFIESSVRLIVLPQKAGCQIPEDDKRKFPKTTKENMSFDKTRQSANEEDRMTVTVLVAGDSYWSGPSKFRCNTGLSERAQCLCPNCHKALLNLQGVCQTQKRQKSSHDILFSTQDVGISNKADVVTLESPSLSVGRCGYYVAKCGEPWAFQQIGTPMDHWTFVSVSPSPCFGSLVTLYRVKLEHHLRGAHSSGSHPFLYNVFRL